MWTEAKVDGSPIRRVAAGPDDVVVVTCPAPLASPESERLGKKLSEALHGAKVIVLGQGMEITCVITKKRGSDPE